MEILHGGQTSTADRISIRIGGAPHLELLGEGDRFIGMASPTEPVPTVYRSDLFPEGFTIRRP